MLNPILHYTIQFYYESINFTENLPFHAIQQKLECLIKVKDQEFQQFQYILIIENYVVNKIWRAVCRQGKKINKMLKFG